MNPVISRELLQRAGCLTRSEFRQRKRAELSVVLKALDLYQLGCAYCPEYKSFEQARDGLRKIKAAQSVKAWGR